MNSSQASNTEMAWVNGLTDSELEPSIASLTDASSPTKNVAKGARADFKLEKRRTWASQEDALLRSLVSAGTPCEYRLWTRVEAAFNAQSETERSAK